jgi:serine/threonine-protein kinase
MGVVLAVIDGPHKGLRFAFDRHDTFLVGRSKHAHFQLPARDKYFSRIHFMLEVNPPQCCLIDMGSHNGTYVNGARVFTADLKDGDQIRAGHTVLRVHVKSAGALSGSVEKEKTAAGVPHLQGYDVDRELGRGALGTTYVGRRRHDGAPMAVKVVTPSIAGSPQQIADFLLAARRLANIDHPHIACLRDVGTAADCIYFATDFVPGINAARVVARDGPLAIRRALSWLVQILDALAYAHARHTIHHDIKPTNVLACEVAGKENVWLTDFGIARCYNNAPFSGLALTTGLLEAAAFMAPEVLFNYQESTPLLDQYSVAALGYFLLTGSLVLDLPSETRRRYSSLLRRTFVPIRERRAEIPRALALVIEKALSRLPSQRFASTAEFREALKA